MLLRGLVLVLSLSCCELHSLRLFGGVSRCHGELQVQRSGLNWTGVSPGTVPLWLGHRVCVELDCGSVLSVGRKSVSQTDVVDLAPDCDDASLIRCFGADTHPSDCVLQINCSESVRLVSGRSLCSGSLQIQDQSLDQSWSWVCDGALDSRGAEVLCRELGCGAPLLQGARSPLEQTFHCEGHESSLMDCPRNQTRTNPETCSRFNLTCSDVRLQGGPSRCEGAVQVKHRGEWRRATAPFDPWDLEAAAVVCRSLGCGSAFFTSLRFGFSAGAMWFIRSDCVKRMAAVRDCVVRGFSESVYGLELLCSGNDTSTETVRLVGGAARCEGTVEVRYRGKWRRARPSEPWDLEAGSVLCRLLDCGSALSTEQRRDFEEGDTWRISSRCVKSVATATDCVIDGFTGTKAGLWLRCSESVRLVSGRSSCSGSLQIRDQSLDQSWSWVCDGALDSRGAEVLCRELGCGAPLLQGALSPLEQMFHCEGHESSLMDCPRNQTWTNPETCSRLNLTCSEPVRLVGGASRCEGSVELQLRGEWRRVWSSGGGESSSEPWSLGAASVVCQSLDCGSALSTGLRQGSELRDVWSVEAPCVRSAAVRDCVFATFSRNDALHVVCSESVRLVSGRSLCSGSLQIRDQSLDQSWSWVCDGALDSRGAEVLCRELGCGAPLLQGALSPLEQTFYCEGHESALMDCSRDQTRSNPETCSRLKLTCSEPVRLVGGASRCEGSVELQDSGEWRPMMIFFKPFDRKDPWDLEVASVICRSVDCGSAVSAARSGISFSVGSEDMWAVHSDCMKATGGVRECVWGGVLGLGVLQLTCSRHVYIEL